MKNIKLLLFILITVMCCQPLMICAEENEVKTGKSNFSKSFQKKFGNRPIAVRQKLSNNRISGYFPNHWIIFRKILSVNQNWNMSLFWEILNWTANMPVELPAAIRYICRWILPLKQYFMNFFTFLTRKAKIKSGVISMKRSSSTPAANSIKLKWTVRISGR